jgi:hypothetical protein
MQQAILILYCSARRHILFSKPAALASAFFILTMLLVLLFIYVMLSSIIRKVEIIFVHRFPPGLANQFWKSFDFNSYYHNKGLVMAKSISNIHSPLYNPCLVPYCTESRERFLHFILPSFSCRSSSPILPMFDGSVPIFGGKTWRAWKLS